MADIEVKKIVLDYVNKKASLDTKGKSVDKALEQLKERNEMKRDLKEEKRNKVSIVWELGTVANFNCASESCVNVTKKIFFTFFI